MADMNNLKLWTAKSLREFCLRKGLKVSGTKEEMVARVFAAMENDVPDVLSLAEQAKSKAFIYQNLLFTDPATKKTKVPDPFTLTEWLPESKAVSMWPPTMYGDICEYFHSLSGAVNKGITKTALNTYKEGKAYSYFDSDWLKEVMFHPIDKDSAYCFLKSLCTPSQNISHVLHEVWVLIQKSNGQIKSAYCTCFAGLGSTCNHVAALLFKLDFYWRQGLTNKACTDLRCSWNRYGAEKTTLKPSMVKDLSFRQPKFGKKKLKSSTVSRDDFQNLNCDSNVTNPFSFSELYTALHKSVPNAVAFKGCDLVSPNDEVNEITVETSIRPSLFECFQKCDNPKDLLKF